MTFLKTNGKKFLVFLAVCIVIVSLTYVRAIFTVPGEITLIEGEEYVYNFRSPFMVNIKADRDGLIKLNNHDIKASGSYLGLYSPFSLKSEKDGKVNLNMKLFGLIPFKTIKVDIVSTSKLAACGNTIGVKLKVNGILVIGVSDVETVDGNRVLPTKESGLKPGDLLVQINGKKLPGIDGLIDEIEKSQGNTVKIRYKRGNTYNDIVVRPVKAIDDKKYHIGLWVRDSTAGIGTLTFYDPKTNSFGALGHGITDIDTGALMPVEEGDLLESNILGVKKGKVSSPGELKGVFLEDRGRLGVIKKNCDFGIYGELASDAVNRVSSKLFPIGVRSQIKEGPAVILANIDGKSVEEYSVEIQKVSRSSLNGSKGMIIKITDRRLLETTGGIVQGMSGSPIIQDDRLIGAVTHVLVNDPTRGYGIFIEGMIKNMTRSENAGIGKAS